MGKRLGPCCSQIDIDMTWNYRIMKRQIGSFVSYDVHEVYYNADGSIKAWTENSIKPSGETIEELKEDFSMQLRAFEKPILDYDQLSAELDNKSNKIE